MHAVDRRALPRLEALVVESTERDVQPVEDELVPSYGVLADIAAPARRARRHGSQSRVSRIEQSLSLHADDRVFTVAE